MTMHAHRFDPANPADLLGLAIIVLGTVATLVAFTLAFRATVWPGENEPDHPKRSILREDR